MLLSACLSLFLLALPEALAQQVVEHRGTALWLDATPDPTLLPELRASTPGRVAPSAAWAEPDARTLSHLASELEAVRPLRHELDGELQIMRRLGAALAELGTVRAQDRDLVYRALCLQGYAVRRYFQDDLATDPAAAELRLDLQGEPVVGAWVDAIALDPDRLPTLDELPDEPELLAFQELRARLLLLPPATVSFTDLPPEVRLVVRGQPAPADRVQLTPGLHHLALVRGQEIVQRERVRLAPGQELHLPYLAPREDLVALARDLSTQPPVVALSEPVVARLATLEGPVELVISGRKGPLRYQVIGGSAVARQEPPSPRGERRGGRTGLALHAALGGAWLYDGDYLLQNLEAGATEQASTVNAVAPAATVGLTGIFGPVALGLGLDSSYPLGEFHHLPVGDTVVRARLFPHLAVGHPLVRIAAGALLPWHLGVGPRLHLPLPSTRSGPLELVAAYTHGLPLSMTAADGQGEFTAAEARMAWIGLGGRLRLPR